MAKKEPKKVNPKGKTPEKSPSSKELSEDQLEQVAGGARLDAFLEIDGIKGEVTSTNPLPIKLFKI